MIKTKKKRPCYNSNMTALLAYNTAVLQLQLHLHAYTYFYTIQQIWLILFWTFKMCNINNMYTNTHSYWPSWSNILESDIISLEFHLFTRSTIGQLLYNTHYLCTFDCCDTLSIKLASPLLLWQAVAFIHSGNSVNITFVCLAKSRPVVWSRHLVFQCAHVCHSLLNTTINNGTSHGVNTHTHSHTHPCYSLSHLHVWNTKNLRDSLLLSVFTKITIGSQCTTQNCVHL